MKKKTGISRLAVELGNLAGRTSKAISRASKAVKETVMPTPAKSRANRKKSTTKARTGAARSRRAAFAGTKGKKSAGRAPKAKMTRRAT